MFKQLRAAIVALVLLTVITGVVYPVVVTVLAQGIFPYQANGSVMVVNNQAVGSDLIGQNFDNPRYIWGRLSATGPVPYTSFNADKLTGSSGSNYGPLNPALVDAAQARIDALRAADPDNKDLIPVDLVTSSASGLDPDISPAAARYQVNRVAKAHGLDPAAVQKLVDQYTQGRVLGILGEAHVNVLKLNLALDAVPGQVPPPAATSVATAQATNSATAVATASIAAGATQAATTTPAVICTSLLFSIHQ